MRAYRETMRRFVRSLPSHDLVITTISIEHILTYLAAFTSLSFAARHRYFREVRCFFRWAVEAGYCEDTPFRGLRNVRLPRKIVQPYTPGQVAQILAVCDPDTPAGLRDRAIVLTLLDTGIRCAECAQLQWDDCDIDTGRLRILHAKGNKQRVVSFATSCQDALMEYAVARGSDPGPFFLALTPHGKLRPGVALRTTGIKQCLWRIGQRTGIARVHAHRFRHTFATWAIEQGAREIDVQHLLGHASPDMVRRYSATYRSEQSAARHAAFSPADGLLIGTAERGGVGFPR
jgi:integrase/recombinase XerC/integrase/recombinase XerD